MVPDLAALAAIHAESRAIPGGSLPCGPCTNLGQKTLLGSLLFIARGPGRKQMLLVDVQQQLTQGLLRRSRVRRELVHVSDQNRGGGYWLAAIRPLGVGPRTG